MSNGWLCPKCRKLCDRWVTTFMCEKCASENEVATPFASCNSQSVTALTELRNDILLVGLPYSKAWADRVDEVIQRLNAAKNAALHT